MTGIKRQELGTDRRKKAVLLEDVKLDFFRTWRKGDTVLIDKYIGGGYYEVEKDLDKTNVHKDNFQLIEEDVE